MRHRLFAALLLVLGPCGGAYAQSVYWDGTDTGANANGGNGTWQNGATNWDSSAVGGTNTAWNNASLLDAVFGGSGGVVTIGAGGVVANDVSFTVGSYTISGGVGATLTLDGSTTPTISVATGTASISATVAGDDGFAKSGSGELDIASDANFAATRVEAGTLAVASGATLASQATHLLAGTTLRIDGAFTGTAGDDTFASAGNIVGALDFGAGDDRITFAGGNLAGVSNLAGGAGNDTLVFSGMTLDDGTLPAFADIERMALANGTALQLARALPLGGGTLSIDAISSLQALDGASIAGSVENAGTIHVGNTRLAIGGDYAASGNALLQVFVSPAQGTGGGLDIDGTASGSTRVAFASDGSTAPQGASIKIIDAAGGAGGTFAADAIVRLPGSMFAWEFGQDAADGAWYLSSDASSLLPEVPAYGVLAGIGAMNGRMPIDLAFGHAARLREGDARCDDAAQKGSAKSTQFDDCHGAWAAVGVDEVRVGANPGAAFSGDGTGLFVGLDIFGDEDASDHTVRGGVYAGVQRGNYWTTGATSAAPAAMGANVRTHTPGFGVYGTFARDGLHIDANAYGQLHADMVGTSDGFRQKVVGESMSVTVRGGKSFAPAPGWTLEPNLQIGSQQLHWHDLVDATGTRIVLEEEQLITTRADLRIERAFTAGDTQWQPWVTVGVEDTFGEGKHAVRVGDTELLPNHAFGIAATVDVGFEARTGKHVSWFGTLSYGTSLYGTDVDRRQATIGARIQW